MGKVHWRLAKSHGIADVLREFGLRLRVRFFGRVATTGLRDVLCS